jgi:hypothetical protein
LSCSKNHKQFNHIDFTRKSGQEQFLTMNVKEQTKLSGGFITPLIIF